MPYDLVKYTRDPLLVPKSLKEVAGQRTGKSPFIDDPDTGLQLNESAAIVEYIINHYGNGKLAIQHGEPNYPEYLYWFAWSNGTLQPAMMSCQILDLAGLPDDSQLKGWIRQRLEAAFELMDKRLAQSEFLAGPELTAADIMTLYSLTTQRYWGPQADLTPYENVVRWIRACSEREAYQRAMQKGDPEMEPLLSAKPPSISLFAAGGVGSDHWKKEKR